MSVRFCSIASGSSGNCIFVGAGGVNILIDAGLSGKRIERGLAAAGIDGDTLSAIFVTHEHSDHTQGVGVLSRRFKIPIYATRGTWAALERYSGLGRIEPRHRRYVHNGEDVFIEGAAIRPFTIPHDAAEPVGYSVLADGVNVTVATDIGHVTPAIRESVSAADILLLESNHDLDMLTYGPYPVHLKRRILSDFGHLSNVAAGALLAEVCGNGRAGEQVRPRRRHVFLGHLSQTNNRPALAYETVRDILISREVDVERDVRLHLAERDEPGKMLVI